MKFFTSKYKIVFFFVLFSIILIASFVFVDMTYFSGQLKKTAINNASSKIIEKEKILSSYFETAKNVLESTSQSYYFKEYINNPKKNKNQLEDIFLTLVKMNKEIMQFRYIDVNGFERVRIDREIISSKPIFVEKKYLQNKASRYYFKDSKNKPLNKVWFSNIDLNIERGQVVKPFVPTLRAILPLKKNGKFSGILIINYFMTSGLEKFSKTSFYDMILMNKKTEILLHYDDSKSWSTYKKNNYSAKNDFPLIYNHMLEKDFFKTKDVVSKKLNLGTPDELILVLQLKKSYLKEMENEKIHQYIIVSSIILILSFFISYTFSKYIKKLIFRINDTNKLNKTLELMVSDKTKELKELNGNLELRIFEEIKKNEQREKQLFSHLKMASMGDMIGNIAHQWRQPLSVISTAASGIKINHEFGILNMDQMLKDLDTIIDKTQYLSQTIDTFRNYMSDNNTLETVDIKNCINNSLAIVKASLDDRYIKVINKTHNLSNTSINTIPAELTEVLINILNNAKDALAMNNISSPWIKISLDYGEEHLIINVEDNASGISPEIITRVFEPYFTTKHKKQGTGLGLHICYRIVTDSLNGDISVKNSKNGALFSISLPMN